MWGWIIQLSSQISDHYVEKWLKRVIQGIKFEREMILCTSPTIFNEWINPIDPIDIFFSKNWYDIFDFELKVSMDGFKKFVMQNDVIMKIEHYQFETITTFFRNF